MKKLLHAQAIRQDIAAIKNCLSPIIADNLLELVKLAENVAQARNDEELEDAQSKMEAYLL